MNLLGYYVLRKISFYTTTAFYFELSISMDVAMFGSFVV